MEVGDVVEEMLVIWNGHKLVATGEDEVSCPKSMGEALKEVFRQTGDDPFWETNPSWERLEELGIQKADEQLAPKGSSYEREMDSRRQLARNHSLPVLN